MARLPQPFSFIRTLTVGFGIAPNLLTLPPGRRKALAGLGHQALTAGGDFHPALRTSAARNGRPAPKLLPNPRTRQAPWHGESACSPCARREPRRPLGDSQVPSPGPKRAERVNDCDDRANPIPICSRVNNCGGDELWTSTPLAVDGLGARLRGFRKSHHFILASLGAIGKATGACSRQPCVIWCRPAFRMRTKKVRRTRVETACPSSKA